jgi:hypothetical protein
MYKKQLSQIAKRTRLIKEVAVLSKIITSTIMGTVNAVNLNLDDSYEVLKLSINEDYVFLNHLKITSTGNMDVVDVVELHPEIMNKFLSGGDEVTIACHDESNEVKINVIGGYDYIRIMAEGVSDSSRGTFKVPQHLAVPMVFITFGEVKFTITFEELELIIALVDKYSNRE